MTGHITTCMGDRRRRLRELWHAEATYNCIACVFDSKVMMGQSGLSIKQQLHEFGEFSDFWDPAEICRNSPQNLQTRARFARRLRNK